MFEDWLTLIGVTFAALLPIANPFSTAPVFAAISHGMSMSRRHQQARMAGVYMAAVLLSALIAGALVLEFFGISMPALRIAGGLVVAKVGFDMLSPQAEESSSANQKLNPTFSHLACLAAQGITHLANICVSDAVTPFVTCPFDPCQAFLAPPCRACRT